MDDVQVGAVSLKKLTKMAFSRQADFGFVISDLDLVEIDS